MLPLDPEEPGGGILIVGEKNGVLRIFSARSDLNSSLAVYRLSRRNHTKHPINRLINPSNPEITCNEDAGGQSSLRLLRR